MRDEFHLKNKKYAKIELHLRKPENEVLWLDHPERLTQLVAKFEDESIKLGAFGEKQEADLSGLTLQQNAAEIALEDAADILAGQMSDFYEENGEVAKAAYWDMELTDWRKLREDKLRDKAIALHTEAVTLSAADATLFGIDPVAFNVLVGAFKDEMAKPAVGRSERKQMGNELRPRYAANDKTIAKMAPHMKALRGVSDAHKLFVDTFFGLQEGGAGGVDGSAGQTPNDPNPGNPTPPVNP